MTIQYLGKKKIECVKCKYHEPCDISQYGYCTWFHTQEKEKQLVPAHVFYKGCKCFINKAVDSTMFKYVLELFKGEIVE